MGITSIATCKFFPETYAAPSTPNHIIKNLANSSVKELGSARMNLVKTCHSTLITIVPLSQLRHYPVNNLFYFLKPPLNQYF
jgi:hypothetical protein